MKRKIACATVVLFLLFTIPGFSQSYDGYTLYFPQNGTKAYLIDLAGNNYHTWTFGSNQKTCYSSYLLPGGVLLRSVNKQGNYFNGGPISGEVQKVDWNGNVIWDFVYSTQEYCTHHDIHPMPNGNVLLISYERKSASEVVQAGCAQSLEMWPDKIVEIQPSGTNGGTVVWEWHIWDHLVQSHDPTKSNYGVVADHPELLNINYRTNKDWVHMNGIDYNEELDQIVFSSHALNEVYVIDHSTTTAQAASHSGGNSGKGGDFLYRWGNPEAYQASGTANFNVVHDAHWVPGDDPRFPNALCGYNNHGGAGGKTCVDIFNPPYNGYNYSHTPGTAYLPGTYYWRNTYSGNYSSNNGNSQQLPNGNTLICIGLSGFMYEIDSNQNQIWSKSVGGTIAQVFRYPPCFITGTYTATAGGAPASICKGESAVLSVSATGGEVYIYEWSSSPPGFTSDIQNPVVSPEVTTTYYVTIKNGPCEATDSITIMVYEAPEKPEITVSGDSLVSSSSGGNQWFVDGNLIQGATGHVLLPSSNGSYKVQVTDVHGCLSEMSDPVDVTWLSATGTHEMNILNIFPNPSSGMVHITPPAGLGDHYEILLLNSIGMVLKSGNGVRLLDLSGFENGIYYIVVRYPDGKQFSKKIVFIN